MVRGKRAQWIAGLAAVAFLQGCLAQSEPREASEISVQQPVSGEPGNFRAQIVKSCSQISDVDSAIAGAIAIGAPIYNAGSALGCYQIYEGAAYKVLYKLGGACADVTAVLRAGLSAAELDPDVVQKAWTMRRTFDTILGEPTQTGITPL